MMIKRWIRKRAKKLLEEVFDGDMITKISVEANKRVDIPGIDEREEGRRIRQVVQPVVITIRELLLLKLDELLNKKKK